MSPNELTSTDTIHERYRRLLRAGFSPSEATSLIARVDGLDRHSEGEMPSGTIWRWQEIARIEFLRFLVDSGRLGEYNAAISLPGT
jgi:hypothetical protein